MSAIQAQVEEIVSRWKTYISSSKIEANSDQVLIDLDTLNDIPFNKNLLETTGIARYVAPIRKCGASDLRQRADQLFQKLCEASRKTAVMRATSSEDEEAKRKKFRDIFYKIFAKEEEKLGKKAAVSARDLSVAVEKAIWGLNDRDERVKRLATALSDSAKMKELQLSKKLLMGELKPERFAAFESEDLMTDAQIEKIARDKKEALDRSMVPKAAFSYSSNFRCRRCGSNYLGHNQMQTRSADEPMTNFLVCGKCGHEWRE